MDSKPEIDVSTRKKHRARLVAAWCAVGLVVLLVCYLTILLTGHTSAPFYTFGN